MNNEISVGHIGRAVDRPLVKVQAVVVSFRYLDIVDHLPCSNVPYLDTVTLRNSKVRVAEINAVGTHPGIARISRDMIAGLDLPKVNRTFCLGLRPTIIATRDEKITILGNGEEEDFPGGRDLAEFGLSFKVTDVDSAFSVPMACPINKKPAVGTERNWMNPLLFLRDFPNGLAFLVIPHFDSLVTFTGRCHVLPVQTARNGYDPLAGMGRNSIESLRNGVVQIDIKEITVTAAKQVLVVRREAQALGHVVGLECKDRFEIFDELFRRSRDAGLGRGVEFAQPFHVLGLLGI